MLLLPANSLMPTMSSNVSSQGPTLVNANETTREVFHGEDNNFNVELYGKDPSTLQQELEDIVHELNGLSVRNYDVYIENSYCRSAVYNGSVECRQKSKRVEGELDDL